MKKSLGVLLVTAALSLSSACGGDDTKSTSADGAKASQAPAAVADRSPSDAPLTRENFVERLGSAQREAGSAHMEMSLAAAGTEATMEGDVTIAEDVKDSATRLTMDLGMATVDMRLVDRVMYLKMGEMTGGKYVRMDLDDPNSPLAEQYGSMGEQVDPQAQLETFEKALVSFENEGDGGELDGVETTKLSLVLDTRKALGEQADTAAKLGGKLPKQLTYVLYVGQGDDLLRRMTMDLAQAPTTIDWSRWGEKVDVQAPKKSEITDRSALGGSAVQG